MMSNQPARRRSTMRRPAIDNPLAISLTAHHRGATMLSTLFMSPNMRNKRSSSIKQTQRHAIKIQPPDNCAKNIQHLQG